MAKIKGINTFSEEGYREFPCLLCHYYIKVKIYPYKQKTPLRCPRCKQPLTIQITEDDPRNGDGSLRINMTTQTAVATQRKFEVNLKK